MKRVLATAAMLGTIAPAVSWVRESPTGTMLRFPDKSEAPVNLLDRMFEQEAVRSWPPSLDAALAAMPESQRDALETWAHEINDLDGDLYGMSQRIGGPKRWVYGAFWQAVQLGKASCVEVVAALIIEQRSAVGILPIPP